MKKIIALLLIVCITSLFLVSCKNGNGNTDASAVNIHPLITHEDVQVKMLNGEIDIAILPEPKATAAILTAKQSGQNYSIKLNLTTVWSETSDSALTMGCIAVNNNSLSAKENELALFLEEYENSINFINDSTNHDTAAQMIVSAGILPKLPIANSALTNLYGSIVYQDGEEMKGSLVNFYNAISIQQPSDAFYASVSADSNATATQTLKIGVMNGPTGMGMAKLINDNANNSKYEFITYSDPTIAITDLKNGEVDLACLPTNAVANAANKGMPISALAINCLGSLYVVAKSDIVIDSMDDLVGKDVYYGVPTSTTQPIFEYILRLLNIEVRTIEE